MKMFAWQRKTPEQIQRAIELYQSGMSWEAIAARFGGHATGWAEAARKHGVKSRTKSEACRLTWKRRGIYRPTEPGAVKLYNKFRDCGMSSQEARMQAEALG